MHWDILIQADFAAELAAWKDELKEELAAGLMALGSCGPQLGRPWVDRLQGSRYPNMKELRLTVPDGEWRVAFAFDRQRRAILLIAGSKSGMSERLF